MPSTATASIGEAFGPDGPEMREEAHAEPGETDVETSDSDWVDANWQAGTARGEQRMEEFLDADAKAQIAGVVRALGAAGITIALMVVILNQVFSMDMVSNTSGPFSVDTIQGPLAGALGLLGLGIFVGGARVVMRQLGGGGGNGGL